MSQVMRSALGRAGTDNWLRVDRQSMRHAPVTGGAERVEGVQSIKRAINVLRAVAFAGERGATLREVSKSTGLHRATAYRILRALFEERMVEYADSVSTYRLGPEVSAFRATMGDRFDIKSLAQPSVDSLVEFTEDVVHLVVRTGFDGLCVTMREGSYPEKALRLLEGDRWPLGVGAANLALLAYLPDAEVTEIIENNAPRLAGIQEDSPATIQREVEETRQRGFAYKARLHQYPPMAGVAVPIFDRSRRPIAALAVLAIASRMDAERQARIAERLWAEAEKVGALWEDVRHVRETTDAPRKI